MAKESKEVTVKEVPKKCGIVMPIAGTDGYSTSHWEAVKNIIVEAAKDADFESDLVSYSDETSIIHSNIINNLYHNEIVVVDVSSRNPNVMFELGIRLAFDKPTIVIKDEFTPYTFDAGVIDHLPYPKGLDYYSILKFKKDLTRKIESTYKKSIDADYRSFLKNFSDLKITKAKLDEKEVSELQYLIKVIESLQNDVKTIKPQSLGVGFSTQEMENSKEVDDEIDLLWQSFVDHNPQISRTLFGVSDFTLFKKWVKDKYPKLYITRNIEALSPIKLDRIITTI